MAAAGTGSGGPVGGLAQAVPPGTDLSVHVRDLLRMHDAVLAGSRPPKRPRTVVSRSWQRVLGLGLEPGAGNARDNHPVDEVVRRREQSPLSLVIDELRAILMSVADASHFLMVVCDAEGIVLWREGASRVQMTADRLGFIEGGLWTEGTVGTNAIGTALAECAPVQLLAGEHFEQQQHPWYCTAMPIHDPRTGELLGVVDVSGPALTLHPAIGALVTSAVRLAEAGLWRFHERGLERLRRSVEPVLAVIGGPLLVVDDHGWVAHHSGVAVRERIEAPQPNRPVAVPGLGLCLPERIGEGWLIRPRASADIVTACLSGDSEPMLDVIGESEAWRTPLTRRHAELLSLLAGAGREGLTARQLSLAVYGDIDHVVTVRAEVSRLRRVVGALVATGPYRLAQGVSLTVAGAPRV